MVEPHGRQSITEGMEEILVLCGLLCAGIGVLLLMWANASG
jgi:hypothetical protein